MTDEVEKNMMCVFDSILKLVFKNLLFYWINFNTLGGRKIMFSRLIYPDFLNEEMIKLEKWVLGMKLFSKTLT